jgi:hypothetical protein
MAACEGMSGVCTRSVEVEVDICKWKWWSSMSSTKAHKGQIAFVAR